MVTKPINAFVNNRKRDSAAIAGIVHFLCWFISKIVAPDKYGLTCSFFFDWMELKQGKDL
ncbi:hypothetical protein [Nostoc sp.]|uniref:hypothetical protein n=1 Tax=Nostoc sp. TaxID=1180 RepID=UPI002FFBAF9C